MTACTRIAQCTPPVLPVAATHSALCDSSAARVRAVACSGPAFHFLNRLPRQSVRSLRLPLGRPRAVRRVRHARLRPPARAAVPAREPRDRAALFGLSHARAVHRAAVAGLPVDGGCRADEVAAPHRRAVHAHLALRSLHWNVSATLERDVLPLGLTTLHLDSPYKPRLPLARCRRLSRTSATRTTIR